MSEPTPTPQEARAALSEATSQGVRVRRADDQLGWMLLGVAAMYLAVGAVISTLPDPRRAGPIAGPAILAIFIVGLVGVVFVGLRIRAYSRTAFLLFGGVIAFNLWNAAVIGVSVLTRWWSPAQPSFHFGLTVAVAVIPLLVTAWLIRRR